MNEPALVKYPLLVRLLHWLHTLGFVLLAITGLVLAFGGAAEESMESFHNTLAHGWIALPVIFFIIRPRTSLRGLKMLFTWGRDDVRWLAGAPRYYVKKDAAAVPPQGFLNTGQKLWWLVAFVTWVLIAVSGLIKEIFTNHDLSSSTVSAMTWVHDVAFGVAGVMFLGHAVLAFMDRESLNSMAEGTVSAGYAREHHARWYADKTGGRSGPSS